MGTIIKTIAETGADPSGAKSTWTVEVSANDITLSEEKSFYLPIPTLRAKYTAYGSKNSARIAAILYLDKSGMPPKSKFGYLPNYQFPEGTVNPYLAPNTYGNADYVGSGETTVHTTSEYFNANNPTQVKVPLNVMVAQLVLNSSTVTYSSTGSVAGPPDGYYNYNGVNSRTFDETKPPLEWGTVANIVLNAPPSFETSALYFDTAYIYTNLTTASVDVTDLTAKFGGYITKAELKIGDQTDVLTGDATNTLSNGTLSILLDTAGTFTPTVTVTDSRGQITVASLESITVNGYVLPAVTIQEAERVNANWQQDDEGTYGLITANISYTDAVTTLLEPLVTSDGVTISPDWFEDIGLTTPINWSNYNPQSPTTIYCRFGGALSTQQSYLIGITPRDATPHSGIEQTQMLPSAFYTIDFLAGGHGIAFGQPSVQDGFECNMDATFHQDLVAQDMTTQEVSDFVSSLNVGGGDEIINLFYPVGSYYETADGTFNPNVAWGGTWALESTAKQPTGESARISGRNTVNVTTTSSITVLTLQFTSETGRVYVHADCAFFTSRYTSAMYVIIDGVHIGYSTTNSTALQRGVVEGIADVEIGAHTATVVLASQDSGTTATLPPYNSYTLFVMDVANPNGGVYKWHRTA